MPPRRPDFDADFRAKGELTWVCPAGHRNSVLPTDDEIRETNRNILFHPEHYTPSDAYDHCPLRRYRICPGCVRGGSLMMAAHGDGCKQWPGGGGGSRHAHCFCFHCTSGPLLRCMSQRTLDFAFFEVPVPHTQTNPVEAEALAMDQMQVSQGSQCTLTGMR